MYVTTYSNLIPGLKKVEQAEKGPPPPPLPPPVEKVVQIGKPAEEEEDDYNDPDDRQVKRRCSKELRPTLDFCFAFL